GGRGVIKKRGRTFNLKARIREAICPVFLAGSLVWLHAADRRLLAAEGGTKTSAPISAQVRTADDYYLGRQNLANLAKAASLVRDAVGNNPQAYQSRLPLSKPRHLRTAHALGP